jgi:hypothetical protein
LLPDTLWHPRTDQTPDGNGLLIGKSLNDAVELSTGLKGRELLGHRRLLKNTPKVHWMSPGGLDIGAVLVGTAARLGVG